MDYELSEEERARLFAPTTIKSLMDNLLHERKTEPGRWAYQVNGESTDDIERIAIAIANNDDVTLTLIDDWPCNKINVEFELLTY